MHPPDGMRLSLYDSASRGNVPFAPADPERVRIYTCGPTVYRYAHIGNLRTYLLTDLLVRTLRFLGYGTLAVQNITDMGHMHQEQLEAGEDKVIVFRPDHTSMTTLEVGDGGLRLVQRGPEAQTGVL